MLNTRNSSNPAFKVVNRTQVEDRRHFRAIKSVNVCERGPTFVIFVVSEEGVTKLDSHLDVIHANTAHLSASITSFRLILPELNLKLINFF